MPAIAAAAAQLIAQPKPVLYIDTCDLLNIVQCLPEGGVARLEHARRLLETVIAGSSRVQIVVTYLVIHEWEQRIRAVREEAERFLRETDERIVRIHQAWDDLNAPLPDIAPTYAASDLVDQLENLSRGLLNQGMTLDRENDCVERALDRVMQKQRPSLRGHIKDAIHLEHYLEFTRQLRQTGFQERCVFVSANKGDFWQNKSTPRLHSDLQPDFDPLNLEFFGLIEAALGSLHI